MSRGNFMFHVNQDPRRPECEPQIDRSYDHGAHRFVKNDGTVTWAQQLGDEFYDLSKKESERLEKSYQQQLKGTPNEQPATETSI